MMITTSLKLTFSSLKSKQNNAFVARKEFIFRMVLSYFVLSVHSNSSGSNHLLKNVTSRAESTGKSSWPLVAKIVSSSLLALLCFSGILWFAFRSRKRNR